MDDQIAKFMLLAAKFEFFLINHKPEFAHIDGRSGAVHGVNWESVGRTLEGHVPFSYFEFGKSGFEIFKETVPMFLKLGQENQLCWDSEVIEINSWETLLGRSYAQLRNNVAHGNKAQLPAPFRRGKTEEFLAAGKNLIFWTADVLGGHYILPQEVYFK